MKTYGGLEVLLHALLTSSLDGGEWSASCLSSFTPGVRAPGTHWIGDCVDPRASLNAVTDRKVPSSVGNRTPLVQPVA